MTFFGYRRRDCVRLFGPQDAEMIEDKPRFSTPSNLLGEARALKMGAKPMEGEPGLSAPDPRLARRKSCRLLPSAHATCHREPCQIVTRISGPGTPPAASRYSVVVLDLFGIMAPRNLSAGAQYHSLSISVFPRLQIVTTIRVTVTQRTLHI